MPGYESVTAASGMRVWRRRHVARSVATLVLDAGLGTGTVCYEMLLRALLADQHFRDHQIVCFDRLGLGLSGPALGARTSQHVADEIRAMLDDLGVQGPVVLVGHSWAGVTARVLASQLGHGRWCQGLLLLDPSHELSNEHAGWVDRAPLWLSTLLLDGLVASGVLWALWRASREAACPTKLFAPVFGWLTGQHVSLSSLRPPTQRFWRLTTGFELPASEAEWQIQLQHLKTRCEERLAFVTSLAQAARARPPPRSAVVAIFTRYDWSATDRGALAHLLALTSRTVHQPATTRRVNHGNMIFKADAVLALLRQCCPAS